MGVYFITAATPEGRFFVDAADLIARVSTLGALTNVTWFDDEKRLHRVEWTQRCANGLVVGNLTRDGHVVTIDGDVEDAARAALFLRDAFATNDLIQFFDEGYSADVALTADATLEDLVKPFLSGCDS